MNVRFIDRLLTCCDCREDFIFTAGEQLFFCDKQFKNDPKRCKSCKAKRSGITAKAGTGAAAPALRRTETRTNCSACGIDTTVPFKPTQGRPVLCRECFQAKTRLPQTPATVLPTSPYYADPTAAALTALSEDTRGSMLTADGALMASSSMVSAYANSSVATVAELALIAGGDSTDFHNRPETPVHANEVEILSIGIVAPNRQETSALQELVAPAPETVLV